MSTTARPHIAERPSPHIPPPKAGERFEGFFPTHHPAFTDLSIGDECSFDHFGVTIICEVLALESGHCDQTGIWAKILRVENVERWQPTGLTPVVSFRTPAGVDE